MSTNHEHDNLNEAGGAESTEAASAGAHAEEISEITNRIIGAENENQTPGFDLSFSAPKSVSYTSEVRGPDPFNSNVRDLSGDDDRTKAGDVRVSENEPSDGERRSNDIYELMKSNILTYGPDYAAAMRERAPHLADAMWGYVLKVDNLDRFHFGEAHSRAVEGMQSQGMRWSEHEGPRETPNVLGAAGDPGRRWPDDINDLTMRDLMEAAAETPAPYGSVEIRELGHRDSYPPDAKIDHAGRPGDRYDLTSYVGVNGTFVSQQDHSCTLFVKMTPGETLREIEEAQARRDRGEASRDRHIFNDLVEHSRSLERAGESLSFEERIFRVNDAVAERVGRITETVLRTVLGESGLQKLDAFIDRILPTSDQPGSNQSQEPTGGYNPPDYPYDERNPFSTTEHFGPGSERRLSSYHSWIFDKSETEPWPGRPEQVTHAMLTDRANGNVAPYTKEEITHALHRNDQLDVAQHASGIGKGPGFEVYNFFGKEGTFVSESHSPATIWLPDRINDVVNDVYHATTQQSEYVERMVEAREAGRDPGPPPRHIFQDLIDRSNERALSGSGQDLRTNAPAAGKASIQVADVIVDLQGLAQSAHHNLDHASARGIRIGGELQGYAVDLSASDVGRDGFDLIQFNEIPGTFVTQFHDTMHVSGDLPDVVRDIADAQVLRDAGEIAPHRPIFDDLREASLQREEQSRHVREVTNYLQEIEAADAELARLREHELTAGREEAGQAPGSQQTFTFTREDLRKILDSAVFLSLEYRDAEGKIAERSIGEVADRTIERLEARAESAHQQTVPNDQDASPAYKESFTLSRERLAKLLDTAIDTSHQPGVGKDELIGWIMTDLDYKADTQTPERTFQSDSSLLGSPALSKLIDTCERAIETEQDFKGGNPFIEHRERLNWLTPMKEAVAEVRQERQQEIDSWLSRQKEQTPEREHIGEIEPASKRSPEESVVRGMVELKPNALTGSLVSIPELRKTVDLPREQLDQALVDLAKAEVAALHRHDFPSSLSKDGRDALLKLPAPGGAAKVAGLDHDYYLGVALRHEAGSVEEVLDRYHKAVEPERAGETAQEQGDTCRHGTRWPNEECEWCEIDYYWPTNPDMPDPEFDDVPDVDPDDDFVHEEVTGERTWPNNLSQITIHELAEGAHHQVAPYSSDEVRQIAEQDRLQVDASARGVGYQDDKFDVLAFKEVPGTFISQGDSTVHVSTDFRETVDGVYQAQDLRSSDGKYADIHVYSDLVEKSERLDERTRNRQLTIEPER